MSVAVCRITGTFVNHLGQARKNLQVDVQGLDDPIVSGTTVVMGQSRVLHTDSSGSLVFDAVRGSWVGIALQDRGVQFRKIYIPDAATANLGDLLYPYLQSVSLALEDTSLDVGQTTEATVTGTLSDTRTLDVTAFATLATSAPSVAAVAATTVSGIAVGSADISVTEVDTEALAENPPTDFKNAFQDARGNVYSRQSAPLGHVALSNHGDGQLSAVLASPEPFAESWKRLAFSELIGSGDLTQEHRLHRAVLQQAVEDYVRWRDTQWGRHRTSAGSGSRTSPHSEPLVGGCSTPRSRRTCSRPS